MKKGLRKLILSGTALAAVAATLGTSTYAWYTTNPTVSANNIVGASADSGSASISISKDTGSTKTWTASVDFSGQADVAGYHTINASALVPLYYDTQGKFSDLNTGTGALNSSTARQATSDVAMFTLFFKVSKCEADVNLYIKSVSLTNTSSSLPATDNLLYDPTAAADSTNDVGGFTDAKATYAVDFRNALGLAVYNADATNGYDAAFTLGNGSYFAGNVPSTTAAVTVSNGDAHTYYDNVMETNLADGAKAVLGAYDKEPIAVLDHTSATYATVKFFVFLNGASTFCYDACIGQDFGLDIQFTTDSTLAL